MVPVSSTTVLKSGSSTTIVADVTVLILCQPSFAALVTRSSFPTSPATQPEGPEMVRMFPVAANVHVLVRLPSAVAKITLNGSKSVIIMPLAPRQAAVTQGV